MNKLVTIRNYESPVEAGLAQSRLEDADVPAFVEGSQAATAMSYVGTALGGVKLQVAAADVERAVAVLKTPVKAGPEGDWDCPQCGTRVEHGFEVCWSCGATRDDEPSFEDEAPPEQLVTCTMCGAEVADDLRQCPKCGEALDAGESDGFGRTEVDQQSVDDEAGEDDVDPAAQMLNRAWKSAWIGTVLCPPLLSIYSLVQLSKYLELRAGSGAPISKRAHVAFGVNILMIVWPFGLIAWVMGIL